MAENKSWLNIFNKAIRRENSEIKSLRSRLEEVAGEMEELNDYDSKFFDAEPNTFSAPGQFEFGGIDQMIDDAVLQRLYATETWVYIPVTAIAKTIGGLPLKLEKKTKIRQRVMNDVTGQEEEIDTEKWTDACGEKLFDRFQYPNKFTTKTEFFMLLAIDLLTTGQYYIYLDSDEDLGLVSGSSFDNEADGVWGRLRNLLASNTAIKGMYRIPPSLMKPVPREDGYGLEGFVMQSDHGQFAFDCAEIIHVKLPNPLNSNVGLAPLIAGLKPVLLDRFSTEHMIRFYKTGARLGGVIETEKSLNKEQLSRFQRSFENNFTGRQNFHRTLILPPGMAYKQIEQNPAETALLEFCKYNREALLAVYNVPPIKVGIMDHANYANALVQLKIFFSDTVMPYLSFIEDGFNLKNTLLPDTRTFRIKFDLTDVEALKENNKEMADTAKLMVDAGLSVNEVRKRIWKAGPVKDGDKVKVIEDMSKPPQAFPISGSSAPEGDTKEVPTESKDAVSPSPNPDAAMISSDLKPTGLTYSQRVAQLCEQLMAKDKLPMCDAICRAIELAKAEGLTPEDPTQTEQAPVAAPVMSSDQQPAKDAAKPTLDQFLTENLSKLNSDEPVSQEFIAQLTEMYKQQYGEPATEKEQQLEIPKTYAFGMTKDKIVENWKGFISKMDPIISKRHVEVAKFFKKFKSVLMNQLGANLKSFGLHKSRDKSDVDEILDPKHYEKLIAEYIAEVDAALLEAYKSGFADTLTTFKFDARNEIALEQLKKYAASKVQGITDTTLDQMRDVLSESFDAEAPISEVTQRINEKFAEIDAGRAETIARTETLTAVSMGREDKREEYTKEFPDAQLKKMWVSAQDDKVRESHQELDGEVRDADEEFKAGLKFPRDPDCEDPAEVINCRCTDITFTEQDQAAIEATMSNNSSSETSDEEKSLLAAEIKVTRGEDESFDDCVKRAIPLLINEGKPQDQAVAMAYSMCQLPKKGNN